MIKRTQETIIAPVGEFEITKVFWTYDDEENGIVVEMIKAEFGKDIPIEKTRTGCKIVLSRRLQQGEEPTNKKKARK